MNILKRNVAIFSSLTFLLFAVVDTAAGDEYPDGKLGKALTLGGNSVTVKIPHYAGLKPAKAITISAWIKPERVGKGEWDWQTIYRKEDGDARALMAIGEYEKKHSLCFGLGVGGKYVDHGVPLEPAKLLDGKWHLVSVTFDGKAITFYADGQEIGAKTVTGSIDTGGEAPAYIGSYMGKGEFFKGGIDDVRLYDRALSAGEIKTMALADGKAAVNGIVGWWKLDGDLKNSAAEAPKTLLAELEGIHTPVMPKSLPSSWLTYHLAHPGPDNARPADPNCAIHYGGIYHLHYIYQNKGHSFAHVTSKDMVHWEWQPSVLTPPATGHGMFSGTAFLTREGKPAIIYHGQGSKRNQIAIAEDDKLNKWSKSFPVEPKTADGKPAEMRHWDPDCWVMNDTYYALAGGKNPTLAKSKDLKDWEFLGELLHPDFPKDLGVPKGEDISCANMFKIGDKWMLLCISHDLGARYYLGDFKDEKFLPEHHAMMNWWGWDFFAPESLLTADGRRVMWSWCTPPIKAWGQKGKVSDLASLMEGDKKLQPGIQSLPRELSLPEDGVLRIKPLRELEKLRSDPKQKRNITVKSDTEYLLKEMSGDTMELELVLDAPSARDFGIKVLSAKDGSGGFTISSGKESKVLNVGYIKPPFELEKGEDLTLRIFIDKSMIEVFANDRQAAVAWHEYDPKDISVSLFSQGGDLKVKSITSWKMNSIYRTQGVSKKSDRDTNPPASDKNVQSMFYKAQHQETGNMWDVWLYHHEGTYYLYYLANVGEYRWRWDNISMATSPDGVHWTEKGPILKKTPGAKWMGTGSTWKSPTFEQDGKFYMNYSEEFDGRQNIYFAESTDLLNWTRLEGEEYRFVQNEQWYKKKGRWDCIWTIPKPGGGLYGYWTAGPDRSKKDAAEGLFGFGESLDGVHWKALAPPKVIDHGQHGEVGAVEKIGDKYYMLFGHYPIMTTLVADRPEGPFRKAKKNYKVLTGHTYFSRFFRHPEGMLACHFTQARDVQVSFAPIKDVRIDQEGTLRFGWWKGNEKMKHRPIAVEKPLDSNAAVALLGNTFDTKQGLIIEGVLPLPKTKDSPRSGVYVECTNHFGAGLLIDSSGVAELGLMNADGTGFKMEKRVDREMTFDSPAAFRLLVRGSLMEFYLDDILIESFALPANASGRIGLINAEDAIGTLKAWN